MRRIAGPSPCAPLPSRQRRWGSVPRWAATATCCAAVWVCAGCESEGIALNSEGLAGLSVDPDTFEGAPECGESGYQTYLVQLQDVTPGADAGTIQLPTSGPVPCGSSVELSFVVQQRSYEAQLFLFREPPSELFAPPPISVNDVTVSTVLLDPLGSPVAPSWVGECSDAVAATQSIADNNGDAGPSAFVEAKQGALVAAAGTRRFLNCRVRPAGER